MLLKFFFEFISDVFNKSVPLLVECMSKSNSTSVANPPERIERQI